MQIIETKMQIIETNVIDLFFDFHFCLTFDFELI